MNIEAAQKLIAKIYSNREFLALFKENPQSAFNLMDTPEADRAFFLSADRGRLEKINSIVQDKQRSLLKNIFPFCFKIFKEETHELAEEFLQISNKYIWSIDGKLRMSKDFFEFCEQKVFNRSPLFFELLIYEHFCITVGYRSIPEVYALIEDRSATSIHAETHLLMHEYVEYREFSFNILKILHAVEKGDDLDTSTHLEKTYLLFIPTKSPRALAISIDPNHYKVLPYLNGRDPFETLAKSIQERESAEVFQEFPRALAFLKSYGVLTLL